MYKRPMLDTTCHRRNESGTHFNLEQRDTTTPSGRAQATANSPAWRRWGSAGRSWRVSGVITSETVRAVLHLLGTLKIHLVMQDVHTKVFTQEK